MNDHAERIEQGAQLENQIIEAAGTLIESHGYTKAEIVKLIEDAVEEEDS